MYLLYQKEANRTIICMDDRINAYVTKSIDFALISEWNAGAGAALMIVESMDVESEDFSCFLKISQY